MNYVVMIVVVVTVIIPYTPGQRWQVVFFRTSPQMAQVRRSRASGGRDSFGRGQRLAEGSVAALKFASIVVSCSYFNYSIMYFIYTSN